MQDLFFKTAFRVGIQRDAALADSVAPPLAEVEAALERAAAAGDKPAYVRAGRLLRDAGRLPPAAVAELASDLLDIGCPDEALRLLQDDRYGAGSPGHTLQSARALAGAERFDEAEEHLRQAIAGGLEGATADTAGQLWDLIKRRRRLSGTSSWHDFQMVIYGCLDLGLARPAVAAWREALARAGGPLSPARDEIVDAAPGALRLSDPAAVDDILLGLGALMPGGDGQALAATAAALRAGGQAADELSSLLVGATPFARFVAGEACAAAGWWRTMIDGVGGLHGEDASRHRVPELARCVGREVLQAHPLTFAPPRAPKVFDLFPFNGEFGLLELKLAEMGPWVDHFVIVEAARTFTGLPKPLHFAARADEYRSYGDKIIHVVVDAGPDRLGLAWAREFHQRDSAIQGLSGRLAPDDIVLLSDADEIVAPDVLGRFSGEVRILAMRTFKFFFNYEADLERQGLTAAIVRGRLLASNGSSYLRFATRPYARGDRIMDAGWHFTSINTAEGLQAKVRSYSHEEHAHLDRDHWDKVLRKIRDGLRPPGYVRRDLDDQLPAYLQRHREALADFIL